MKGLYNKYVISKANGKPLAKGFYAIVLRIDGGQYAEACRAGALEFARCVEQDNPELAEDIKTKIYKYWAHDAYEKLKDAQ